MKNLTAVPGNAASHPGIRAHLAGRGSSPLRRFRIKLAYKGSIMLND